MSPLKQIDGKIEAEGELYLTERFWKNLNEIYSESLEKAVQPLIEVAQEPERLDWYDIRDYKLSEERKNFRINDFPGEGDIVFVISITGSASIKFDSPNADPFDLSLDGFKKIKHRYSELYLTNEAQEEETLKILFGRGDWDFIEKIPEMDIQGTVRNDYLDQITDPLKIGQIIKDGHIVPHADIACEKILITGTTRLDQWRSTEDYTFIAPGKILLHATTKLSDWQHPANMTYIHGGQIYTESITAQQIAVAAITAEKIAAINADISTITAGDGAVVIDENGIVITDGYFKITGKTKGDVVIGDIAGDHLFWDQDAGKLYITGETEFVGGELGWSHILDDNGKRPLDAWRYTGKTTIDGGQIETDTVTALQIAVAQLSAIAANVGTLTAGLIKSTDERTQFDLTNGFMSVSDGVYIRFKAGKLNSDYGIDMRDAAGKLFCSAGHLQQIWEKVYDAYTTSPCTQVSISGLNGNDDQLYFVFFKAQSKNGAHFGLRFNNDSGANYGVRWFGSTGGGVRTNDTWFYLFDQDADDQWGQSFQMIDAKTGKVRTGNTIAVCRIIGKNIGAWYGWGNSWSNTVDNITSIQICAGAANGMEPGAHISIYKIPAY